jgi:predicted methyltransferase
MGEGISMNLRTAGAILGAAAICAMSSPVLAASPDKMCAGAQADAMLLHAISGAQRSPDSVARDRYRHPCESLAFWGLKPGMTILEIWPGGGYWTEILAPYAKATGGKYIAANPSSTRPLPVRFSDAATFGTITSTVFSQKSGPLVAPGSVDFVLTARNIHDWMRTPGMPEKAMADFYAALKPGGILAVEQHRADPRPMAADASDGYMSTAYVVRLAEKAGFKLDGQSEINANPKDTKDYPFGVWTLPPTRQSAESGQPPNPAFDHSKYDAIGESDRMTLRFYKPI